jgi:hypothetical protein
LELREVEGLDLPEDLWWSAELTDWLSQLGGRGVDRLDTMALSLLGVLSVRSDSESVSEFGGEESVGAEEGEEEESCFSWSRMRCGAQKVRADEG